MKNLYNENIIEYDIDTNSEYNLELNAKEYLENPEKLIKWYLTRNNSEIILDLIKDTKNKDVMIKIISYAIYNSLPLTLKTFIVREFINYKLLDILDIDLNKINNRNISNYIYSKLLRKPNIHIYTADNRDLEYIKLSTEHNFNISKKYNFKYTFINDFNYGEYPPYWMKVFKIRELMNDINNDYLVWVDSDAVLTSNLDEIKRIVENIKDKVFYISRDHPEWESNGINAGVWIVKNNNLGKKFMDIWLEGYSSDKWKFIKNKWQCNGSDINQKDIYSPCPWSGHDFEQGYLNYLISNDEFIKNNIFIFENDILNGHYDTTFKKNTIVYHFSGMENKNDLRYQLMNIVINNF
jgi:hypothetical protein